MRRDQIPPRPTMLAAQVTSPGVIEVVETAKPALEPGCAVVQTRHVSLCGSDHHVIHHSPASAYPLGPGVSAHEVVGVVEAIDAPETSIRPGDWVMALTRTSQGMAEYLPVAASDVLPLPSGRPPEELLQAQQLGTVIYAARHLPASVLGRTVAVIGQGSSGLWWNYVLRRLGACRVIALDLQAHRLQLSATYGATDTVHCIADGDPVMAVQELARGELPDVVVEAAGEAASIRLAVNLVRHGGAILYYGIPRLDTLDFPFFEFFRKYTLTRAIAGTLSDPGHRCTRVALRLIASGRADARSLLTHRFRLGDAGAAYALQGERDAGAVKIVVDIP